MPPMARPAQACSSTHVNPKAHCSLGPLPAHPCLQPQPHTHHLEADSVGPKQVSCPWREKELVVLMGGVRGAGGSLFGRMSASSDLHRAPAVE